MNPLDPADLIGIKFDVPMAAYRAAPGISQTNLKEVGISAKHYLSAITEEPKEPTDAQIIGTIIHSAVLENDLSGFVVAPDDYDGRSSEGKKWKAAQSKPIIKREIAQDIRGMITSVKNHPMACALLYGPQAKREVCAWKTHGPTGLLRKARADVLTQDKKELTTIVDLKSVPREGGKQEEFSKSIFNWGYDVQSAWYLDIFEATFWCFVVVEKTAPYAVACYSLSDESIAIGRAKYERYLAVIEKCTKSGIWEAYGDELKTINLPEWVMRKENL